MIFVREKAESRLMEMLESLQTQQPGQEIHCVHFRFSDFDKEGRDACPILIRAAKRRLPSRPESFLCADGDLFILSPHLTIEDARHLLRVAATALDEPQTEHIGGYYNLQHTAPRLMAYLQQKADILHRRNAGLLPALA